MFGRNNQLDLFGRYIINRQQILFKAFDGQLPNIYKSRCKQYYNHNLFGVVKLDKGSGQKEHDSFDVRVKKDKKDIEIKDQALEANALLEN